MEMRVRRRWARGWTVGVVLPLVATSVQAAGESWERDSRVVRFGPEVRYLSVHKAVEPLPTARVRQFLRDHRVVDDASMLEGLAYVVAGDDRRLISGAGDQVYARGELQPGRRYGVYRVGEHYIDTASEEELGLELISIGQARAERREGDVTALRLLSTTQEVRNEDIVLPLEVRELTAELLPRPPKHKVKGTILGAPDGVRFIGQLQVVALDRGHRDDLAVGHVLEVEQQGEQIVDPRSGESLSLPGSDAGQIMLFQVYEKMSYGLVMRATRSLMVGDRVHTPLNRLDEVPR